MATQAIFLLAMVVQFFSKFVMLPAHGENHPCSQPQTLHDKTTDFVTYEATPACPHMTIHHRKQKIAWVAMAL